nr:transforming growth factor beta-1-induced transcript 1 protein [Pogona vitticeps]
MYALNSNLPFASFSFGFSLPARSFPRPLFTRYINPAGWLQQKPSDALLADLETTTSHISKRPVLLTDSGGALNQDRAPEPKPSPPPYNPQQQGGPTNMPVDPLPASALQGGSDKEHLYSTVCKPRSPKPKEGAPPPFSSSSGVLGAGLCELDRLLQELNATQFNITDEIMSQFPSNKSSHGDKPEDLLDDSSLSRLSAPASAKPSATSATLELDKLMASLSDFRVQSNLPGATTSTSTSTTTTTVSPPPAPARVSSMQLPVVSSICPSPPVAPPQMSPAQPSGNLDSMLVMLESDLSRQGISTTAKGLCASCQKPIAGQVVTALGSTWHPEHFVCTHCQKEMGGSNFFEKDGAPYCERDYFQLFSPRCGLCNEPILDKMVTALDKNWHPEHFCCVKCGRPFGEEGFHEKDGKQYCRQDFYELFSTRCQGCNLAILENYISALNALWHPECFVCRVSGDLGAGRPTTSQNTCTQEPARKPTQPLLISKLFEKERKKTPRKLKGVEGPVFIAVCVSVMSPLQP